MSHQKLTAKFPTSSKTDLLAHGFTYICENLCEGSD
jgi:hypothetical protein